MLVGELRLVVVQNERLPVLARFITTALLFALVLVFLLLDVGALGILVFLLGLGFLSRS